MSRRTGGRNKKPISYDERIDDEALARELQEQEYATRSTRSRKKSKYEDAEFGEPEQENFEQETRRNRKKPERFVETFQSPAKNQKKKVKTEELEEYEENGDENAPKDVSHDEKHSEVDETSQTDAPLDKTQPIQLENLEVVVSQITGEEPAPKRGRGGRAKKKIVIPVEEPVDLNKTQEIFTEENPPIEKEGGQDVAPEAPEQTDAVLDESSVAAVEGGQEDDDEEENPESEADYIDGEDDDEADHDLDASIYDQECDTESDHEMHIKSARLRQKKQKELMEDRQYSLRPKKDISLVDPVTLPPQPPPEPKPKRGRPPRVAIGQEPKRKSHPDDTDSEDERNPTRHIVPVDKDLVDQDVTWDSVGGLHGHIESLKEMILLPMLYPEIFQKFNITPPKGVLFFGPPGTGKTLMARTLANTCTKAGEPIHFFMRKGADVLSKWVGEAEKELRLLFEEAREKQPSIIFFDEIDGLAPARTNSSQSQHSSSIVATLLALMDGLDSRGNVIVIGATNRIDSLDPALRRPGRFDRELTFTLPSRTARNEILAIHTKAWDPPLEMDLLDWIGEKTVGYCGADIKSLCTEAALIALKRRFPQIYKSEEKLVIDTNRVKIQREDFVKAMSKITPASHRSSVVHSRPMPYYLTPVLSDHLGKCKKLFKKDFHGPLFRPWLLIHGEKDMGQNYIARALLYEMEEFPIYSIGLPSLISSNIGKEEALIINFAEARKNVPSILFIPDLDSWWEKSTELMKSSLITMMEDLPSTLQVFVLAYSNCPFDSLDSELQDLFKNLDYSVGVPSKTGRLNMLTLLDDEISRKKETLIFKELQILPKAPVMIRELTSQQKKNEEKVMFQVERELRCIMQTVLAEHKRFEIFFNAKDQDGQPLFSVYDIDKKLAKYYHPDQFISDFKFFADNASMYADTVDPYDEPLEKRIESKGRYLYQSVVHLVDKDFPKDLVAKCDEVRMRRQMIKESLRKKTDEEKNPVVVEKAVIVAPVDPMDVVEKETVQIEGSLDQKNDDEHHDVLVEDVIFDEDRFKKWLDATLDFTELFNVQRLDKTFCEILSIIHQHKDDIDKKNMLDAMESYVKK